MRDRDGLVQIRDLLSSFGRRIGMPDAPATGIIWARWSAIVGPQIAQHAEPSSLKDGVLRVRTDSPAWATEIGYLGADIASAANREAGRDLVQRVAVWTGPRPQGSDPELAPGGRERPSARLRAERIPSSDPMEAFEAARRAWRKHREKRGL